MTIDMTTITVTYADRATGAAAGEVTFCAKDFGEASALAAEWRSAHPALLDTAFEVRRGAGENRTVTGA